MGLSRAEATAGQDMHLTNIAASVRPADFTLKNDVIAPPLRKIGISSGFVEIFTRRFMRANNTVWANGDGATPVDVDKPTTVPFITIRHGEKILITEKTLTQREQAGVSRDAYRKQKIEELTYNLLLQKELAMATKVLTSANYDAGLSTSLSNTWAVENGDPKGDIETGLIALRGHARPGTHIISDITTRIHLERHAASLVYGSPEQRSKVSDEDFRRIYGLIPIWCDAMYEDEDGAMQPVMQDDAIIAHMAPVTAEAEGPATFLRTIVSQDFEVHAWWDEDKKGFWYRVSEEYIHQWMIMDNATDKDSAGGYLIGNVY